MINITKILVNNFVDNLSIFDNFKIIPEYLITKKSTSFYPKVNIKVDTITSKTYNCIIFCIIDGRSENIFL